MGQYTTLPITNRTLTDYTSYVYLKDFGAVGNGSTDDTVAINTCFASVKGTAATVVIAPGNYKITDTIIIGANTGGAGAVTSFISVECPAGNQGTIFSWSGPVDGRPAVLFAKNKYATVYGLNINNQAGSKGTSVGCMLGGSGAGSFGNQVIDMTFHTCSFVGFFTGVADGNFGAASEIVFTNCTLSSNTTGWVMNDFNSLDHVFISPNMSDNAIGIDSGTIECFWVFGGSSTNFGIDFMIRQNASDVVINDFRSEHATFAVKGDTSGGRVNINGCLFKNPTAQVGIGGHFSSFNMTNTVSYGSVALTSANQITMVNNTVPIYTATGLPFSVQAAPPSHGSTHVFLRNNSDFNFPPVATPDWDGFLKQAESFPGGPFFDALSYGTGIQKIKQEVLQANTGVPFPYDTILTSYVRQLAEGPSPNAETVFSTTVLTNAATAVSGNTLHFAAVPANVVVNMLVKDTTSGAISNDTFVLSLTATTVVLSNNVVAPGVGSGDTIAFSSMIGVPTPGNNLRVMGQFATSATLSLTFLRNVTVNFGSGQFTATVGNFFKSDVGKPIKVAGNGTSGWTDWYGAVYRYINSTNVLVDPASMADTGWAAQVAVIGADEPDANYMVVVTGDANETFWVDTITTTGFTVHSSNVNSTATVTALIVR